MGRARIHAAPPAVSPRAEILSCDRRSRCDMRRSLPVTVEPHASDLRFRRCVPFRGTSDQVSGKSAGVGSRDAARPVRACWGARRWRERRRHATDTEPLGLQASRERLGKRSGETGWHEGLALVTFEFLPHLNRHNATFLERVRQYRRPFRTTSLALRMAARCQQGGMATCRSSAVQFGSLGSSRPNRNDGLTSACSRRRLVRC